MDKIFYLPDFGEGLQEAKIIKWHSKTGDKLTANSPVVTVETSKTAIEITCEYDCQIQEQHGSENTIIAVGKPLYSYSLIDDSNKTVKSNDDKIITGQENMHNITQQAWSEAVHTVAFDDIDISSWYKKQHILYKITQALQKIVKIYPELNGHYDASSYKFSAIADINLGIAYFNKNKTDILIMQQAQKHSETTFKQQLAQAKNISQEHYQQASILLSNVGMMGGRFYTPLVIPPLTCTIAIGKVSKRAVIKDDKIHIGQCMPISISTDHRIIPGAILASSIELLKSILEEQTVTA